MEKFLDTLNKKQIKYLCKTLNVNDFNEFDYKEALFEFLENNNTITEKYLIELIEKKKYLDFYMKTIKQSLDNKLFLDINEPLLHHFNNFKSGNCNFNEYKNNVNDSIINSHLINAIIIKNIRINLKNDLLTNVDLKLFIDKIPHQSY